MTQVTTSLFDAATAEEGDLRACYAVIAASAVEDGRERPSYEGAMRRLAEPAPGVAQSVTLLGRVDGVVVGLGSALLPGEENAHLAPAWITVHPEYRRRGVGTVLLKALLPELVAQQRVDVEAWGVAKDGVGEEWARGRGFERILETVFQQLDLTTVDRALWDVDTPTGFSVTRWVGSAPEDLLPSYAHARTAMADASFGDSSHVAPESTPERIRAAEVGKRRDGVEHRVVVALDAASGEVVGFTEVDLRPGQEVVAHQGDTAVLRGFRGHGLGRLMKSRMASWIAAECPELTTVETSTASTNAHMIAVNEAIGYATTRRRVVLRAKVEALIA
ncbi:GNAT family N-acetyltransferase [Actinokineospora sp. NPDC004072]